MAKLTEQNIALIREKFEILGTYAATARETGFSASTVKKYVTNIDAIKEHSFLWDKGLSVGEVEIDLSAENIGFLTEEEQQNLNEFIQYLKGV